MTIFGSVTNVSRHVLNQKCVDYVWPGLDVRDKPFELHTVEIDGSTQSGKANYFIYLDEYPSILDMGSFAYPVVTFSSTPDSVYSRMVAGTAPHRANFNIPTYLAEGLKDWPGTVKRGFEFARYLHANQQWIANRFGRWTRSKKMSAWDLLRHFDLHRGSGIPLARNLASANLAIQFGFAPFVSDILKAANLAKSIENRRKEFLRLTDQGNLARRWDTEEVKGPVHTIPGVQVGPYVGYPVDVTVQSIGKQWATVRWATTPNTLLPKTNADMLAIMTGLTIPNVLLAGWEALPWSWMVDYFGNVGDVLAATANGAQYTVSGCVMQYVELRASHPGIVRVEEPAYNCYLSSGSLVRSTKQRFVYVGQPELSFFGDLLSPKQVSILLSLAATKGLAVKPANLRV